MQCDGLLSIVVNACQCDAVGAVLCAALEADDPAKLDSALACSTAARGLAVDAFEGPCAPDYFAAIVDMSDTAVIADAPTHLAVVRKVGWS